jgi:hypothetical protein
VQALDLLVSAPRLHLLRTVAIGSEAAEEAGLRRSNNTFVSSVAKGVFWPHEARAEVAREGANVGRGTQVFGCCEEKCSFRRGRSSPLRFRGSRAG